MAITNMRVSYAGSTITVKIPTLDVPAFGQPLPFSITSMPTLITIPASMPTPVSLAGLTPSAPLNGYVSYSIQASSTESYMVRVPNPSGTTMESIMGTSTPFLMQGEEYSLLPGPNGGNDLIFKNLDPVGPLLQTLTTLDAYIAANPGNTVETPGPVDGKAYFVAKFNEAVNHPSPMSFNVSQNGVSSQPQQVQALWQTGNVLSTTTTTNLPLSSVYLVTVNVPQGSAGTPVVTLVPAPPTITSVQEMGARPPWSEMDSGNSVGGSAPIGMSPNESWLKVTLEGSAGQFLLGQNGMVPRLQYTFAPDDGWSGYIRDVTADYAVRSTSNSNLIYLGFRNSVLGPSDNPDSIAFVTSVPTITDRAGNLMGSTGSRQIPQYLDAAGEPKFSSFWEGDTTTITNASVYGYANGANVLVDQYGGKTYLPGYDSSLPSYFTDGKPLGEDANGNPTYDVYGYRIGMDTIDLSGITGGPMIINADDGQAFVYSGVDGEEALVLDVSDYDRYILNDRASDSEFGNEFYGTEDSEYVVVGSGGDNYLVAGNLLDPTDISAGIKVKNYQFDTDGIVRETDIVDYSQLNMGITVHLGDDASEEVFVLYEDDTDSDIIVGFEGVVGSGGNDVISGSNVGNVLVGGAGDDELRGYTDTAGAGDKLYNQAYLNDVYKGPTGTGDFQAAQFLVDSSDILYGGAGDDDLFGGAGRDMLIDLGNAEMLGSDKTGFSGDGTIGLRDSKNKEVAENDVFWVRGDGAEKATINNFHLSKDGTGLAGRSNSANDAIMFSIDTTKLFGATAMTSMYASFGSDEALYNYVYSRLTFEQIHNNVTNDLELVVNFKKDNSSQEIKVGSTIIADIGTMLNDGANRAEVVELKWLSKGDDPLYLFNPKIDMDLTEFVEADEFGPSMNIAVALELLQAGTVRGTNDYGVMAAKLSDNDLDERVYNPGDKDDRILGTASDDSYEYIVQQFTPTPPAPITPPGQTPPTPTTPAVITDQVGKDKIFDTGGDDVLMFESASLQDLVFSAVKVGRESKANSLKVVHKQKETLDDGDVKNEGEVVWQGHYKEGGRQAAEVLKIKGGEFEIAQAVYEYNAKGYAKGGPKITADNASDVIMVGQGNGDKFVFDFDAVASVDKTQTARIAGFGLNDKIDISKFGLLEDSVVTHNVNAGMDSTVKLEFDTGFVLNLSFQGAVTNTDLNFALGSVLLT